MVGQASATLISISEINQATQANLNTTGDFVTLDSQQRVANQELNSSPQQPSLHGAGGRRLSGTWRVGGLKKTSGLLIDTFVPTTTGNLAPRKRPPQASGLSFFGTTYTPTTTGHTLDTLDFTSITGDTF